MEGQEKGGVKLGSSKVMVGLLVIVLMALAAYWITQNPSQASSTSGLVVGAGDSQNTQPNSQSANAYSAQQDTNLKYAKQFPDLMKELANYQVGTYSYRADYLPPQVFSKLPLFPTDFWPLKLLVEKGKITRMELITESYWRQPEFYPEWDSGCLSGIQHPPTDRFVGFGLAVYPSETIVLSPKNSEFDTYFFLRSTCLMKKLQGVKIVPLWISSSYLALSEYPDGTRDVSQDPEAIKKYFDISVTPDTVLLQPTFPIYENDWVYKIKVHVKVKNPPSGKYALALDLVAPDEKQSNEWLWKYKNDYVEAGTHTLGYPWYKVFIEV